MSDLIERLNEAGLDKSRSAFDCANCGIEANLVQETIDEIERLTAEHKKLLAQHLAALDKVERLQERVDALEGVVGLARGCARCGPYVETLEGEVR